jgi:hypothetical protein
VEGSRAVESPTSDAYAGGATAHVPEDLRRVTTVWPAAGGDHCTGCLRLPWPIGSVVEEVAVHGAKWVGGRCGCCRGPRDPPSGVGGVTARTYAELVTRLLDKPETHERTGGSGALYQVELQAFWDDRAQENLRVMASIDVGGLRAFLPLSNDFIRAPDGLLVGE